jgi:hypothetical protein
MQKTKQKKENKISYVESKNQINKKEVINMKTKSVSILFLAICLCFMFSSTSHAFKNRIGYAFPKFEIVDVDIRYYCSRTIKVVVYITVKNTGGNLGLNANSRVQSIAMLIPDQDNVDHRFISGWRTKYAPRKGQTVRLSHTLNLGPGGNFYMPVLYIDIRSKDIKQRTPSRDSTSIWLDPVCES